MARRSANGEGTIYRRKDGRYEGAVYVLTTSGSRKRLRVYGTTRAEVHAKLLEAKVKQQHGIPAADKTWRLGEYLDYWLNNAVRLRRRPLTHRRHEAIVRLYLKPGLGKYSLDGLSVRVVQRFLDHHYSNGRSAATVYQIRKVLSAALTYAVRNELLARNVARLVELPTYKPDEAEYWSADEVQQFLLAAQSDPLHPVFALLALYGLRSGEVRGIRWCDVDFEDSVLRIRQQVQRIDGVLQQVPLKTDSSRRDEPLLLTARQVLTEQQTKQAAARAAAGASWQGPGDSTGLVFTTKSGRPIEARNLFRSFRRICEQHNVRPISLHGFRHTNATTQKDLQVHPRDIQAILGHGDVRTTGIYEHVAMASKRDALEKVELRLFSEDGDGSECSRQFSRQSHNLAATGSARTITKENTHPCGVGVFFGGSSQTRTGDTRLFKSNRLSVEARTTEVQTLMQARTRQWILGIVAVNLAVKNAR